MDIVVTTLVSQVLGRFNVPKRRFAPSIWGSSTFPRIPSSPPIKGGLSSPQDEHTQEKSTREREEQHHS
jgi:hypothetical protein